MVHSSARSPLEVGTLIADTYTIERIIGKGGMGAVFLASHARLPGKQVAIKVLHTDVADSESLARFRREAEIATRLGHANIVEVHDFNFLPDGSPYLVLEFLHGESLAQRLARGPVSLEHTYAILRQVGSALVAAHREEIIHRDLKPANIFLVPTEVDGAPTERAKVLDFGISKIRGSQTIKTQDTSILGTPQYMAPEQALGNHAAVDARTDVFALGAMVYEMLCGKPAFGGASVPEVVFKVVYEEPLSIAERVPMLPGHVVVAVHRALAKKPDDRFPDVASFVEALTGAPLTSGKRPMSIAPSDGTGHGAATGTPVSDKISTREAFDQTIGSGDHGNKVAITGVEATMASGSHAPAALPALTPAPALDARSVPAGTNVGVVETMNAPPSGKGKLVIAAVAIVAIAAVAIVFLVTRPKDATKATETPKDPDVVAVVAPDAAAKAVVVPDAGTVAVPVPDARAGSGTGTGTGTASGTGKGTGTGTGSSKPPKEDDDGALKECNNALSSGDPEEALDCVNAVLAIKTVPAAFVVKGAAFCAMGDQEKALGMLRRLAGKPALRKKLISRCKREGVELE